MTTLSDPLVLWGPSSILLDSYKHVAVDSRILLRLIQKGHVRVAAREKWLTDSDFRDHYPDPKFRRYAKWTRFDDTLVSFLGEDEKYRIPEDLDKVRVLIAPPEKGRKYAEEKVKHPNDPIVKTVQRLIDEDGLPPKTGFKEKSLRKTKKKEKLEQVLRDMRNHVLARTETYSNLTVFPGGGAHWLYTRLEEELGPELEQELAQRDPNLRPLSETERDAEKLLNGGVKVMKRMGCFPKAELLEDFLESPARGELLQFVDQVIERYSPLRGRDPEWCFAHMTVEMEREGLLKKSWLDWTGLKTPFGIGVTATDVVMELAVHFLSFPHVPLKWVEWGGLTVGLIPREKSFYERVFGLSLSGDAYNGKQWPFYATIGKKATYSEIQRQLRLLEPVNPEPSTR